MIHSIIMVYVKQTGMSSGSETNILHGEAANGSSDFCDIEDSGGVILGWICIELYMLPKNHLFSIALSWIFRPIFTIYIGKGDRS